MNNIRSLLVQHFLTTTTTKPPPNIIKPLLLTSTTTTIRRMKSTTITHTFFVICDKNAPAVQTNAGFPPTMYSTTTNHNKLVNTQFIVGNHVNDFMSHIISNQKVNGIIFVPLGGTAETFESVLDQVQKQQQQQHSSHNNTDNKLWIHSFFAGVDKISKILSTSDRTRNTILTNGRGAFSESLGEWIINSLLYFNKQVPRLETNKNLKKYEKFIMNTFENKCIGFLGLGDIAKHAIRLLQPWRVGSLIAYRRNCPSQWTVTEEYEGCKLEIAPSLQEFTSKVDFIVSTLPGTVKTQDLVNAQFLNSLKKGSVFINVGRGSTVNEDDLVQALHSGQLAGAALDVFKIEPLPESSPLWTAPNILISPHNADNTPDYINLGWKIWASNYDLWVEEQLQQQHHHGTTSTTNNNNSTVEPPNNKRLKKMTYFDPSAGY
jgi:phosphoglycerate dehydrogenase-like enzyme